jgi:hypothetical protein
MSISVLQRRTLSLAIALLLFTCGRVVAQTTSGQSINAIPQQIKTNAEAKANTKANTVANSATDKLDSGMNKAWKGLGKMFKKKPKPGKDSLAAPNPGVPGAPGVPNQVAPGAPNPGAPGAPNPVVPGASKTDTATGRKNQL